MTTENNTATIFIVCVSFLIITIVYNLSMYSNLTYTIENLKNTTQETKNDIKK